MNRRLPLIVCLLLASLSWAAPPELATIVQLREQRQFDEAEKIATAALDGAKLSDRDRLSLTLELARCYAEHALDAEGDKRQVLWRSARELVNRFAQRYPRHPELLVLQTQGALAALAEAQQLREDAELAGNQPPQVTAARAQLRTAIAEAARLDDALANQIQARAGERPRAAAGLDLDQLESLERNLRLAWARGLREQALSYSESSADQVNSLSRALEVLRPLAGQQLNTPLAWRALIEEVTCSRLIEDLAAVEHRLERLGKSEPPVDLLPLLRAERIRVALARNQFDEALAEASPGAPRPEADWSQADLALLEVYLANWQAALASGKTTAREWEVAAVGQVGDIARQHGKRIARRADQLLAHSVARVDGPLLPGTVARVAEGAFRRGDFPAAVAGYDRTVALARQAELPEVAQAAQLAAAELEKQQQHWPLALERYLALATALGGNPQAAQAHQWAVYCAAQAARDGQAPRLARYQQLLEEHVARWPTGPTAAQCWSWLGRLREHQGQYQAAIEALRHVTTDDPRMLETVADLQRCYSSWLAQLGTAPQARQVARDADACFDHLISLRGRPPRRWTALARAAALAKARLLTDRSLADAEEAEVLLQAALDGEPAPSAGEQHALALARVVALVAADRLAPAEELLQSVELTSDDRQLLCDDLARARGRLPADRRRAIAQLELEIVEQQLAHLSKQPPAEQLAWQRRRGQLLDAAGRRGDAVAALTDLAARHPEDGQTQEALAELLARGDAAEQAGALAKWREISTRTRPGSPRWWRAHLGQARSQLALGQSAEAGQTLAALEHAASAPADAETQAQLAELRRQVDQPARQQQK